jgi:hypothetical protein
MGVEAAAKPPGDWWWSGPQVQISVIVAITQQSFLRIEAGNGFVTTEFGHELVGPKPMPARALLGLDWSLGTSHLLAKGKRVKSPSPFCSLLPVTAPKNTGDPSYGVGVLRGEFRLRLSITATRALNRLWRR